MVDNACSLKKELLNVSMKATVEAGLFTGYSVGMQVVDSISHLLFADDTLMVGVKPCANVRALKNILLIIKA